jgi:hypothetical protein
MSVPLFFTDKACNVICRNKLLDRLLVFADSVNHPMYSLGFPIKVLDRDSIILKLMVGADLASNVCRNYKNYKSNVQLTS